MKKILLLSLAIILAVGSSTWAATTPLTQARHIFIDVANDAGVKYNYDGATYAGPDGTYYIKADGGGLGSNHITTDFTNPLGQTTVVNTASNSVSGTFYVNDTGGRGFTDDAVLLLSSTAPITDDFSITIQSSGYTWTPNPTANVKPTVYSYVTNAVNETFGAEDFMYGPNAFKPGPNGGGAFDSFVLPFYYGQDTSNPATAQYLMFVDLNLGMLDGRDGKAFDGAMNDGAVKVDFAIDNLYADVAFNVYGWALNSNQGEGINWTNTTNGDAASSNGYVIHYTGEPPVATPEPMTLLLVGLGLIGLAGARKKRA